MLNDILVEASKLTPEERHTRIKKCLAVERHDPAGLPFCLASSSNEVVRYCRHCWSVIDPYGLTWSWPPPPTVAQHEGN